MERGNWVRIEEVEALLRDNEALRFAAELNRDTVMAQQRVYNLELLRLTEELHAYRSGLFGQRRKRR